MLMVMLMKINPNPSTSYIRSVILLEPKKNVNEFKDDSNRKCERGSVTTT
jgi:hypothetical protein